MWVPGDSWHKNIQTGYDKKVGFGIIIRIAKDVGMKLINKTTPGHFGLGRSGGYFCGG